MTGFIFDANQYAPVQGVAQHPVGTYDFTITNTEVVPKASDTNTNQLKVTLTSPYGTAFKYYGMWDADAKSVERSFKALSALCHATGKMHANLNPGHHAEELRGGRGKMVITQQKGEGKENLTQIDLILDINGNEPGKAPAPTGTPAPVPFGTPVAAPVQQYQPQPAPMQQFQQIQPGQPLPPQAPMQPFPAQSVAAQNFQPTPVQQAPAAWGTPQAPAPVAAPVQQFQQQAAPAAPAWANNAPVQQA